MSVTNTPIYPQLIVSSVLQLNNASGTTIETVLVGGTNGTKIESILVSSTDTSARDITFYITISATSYAITTVTIPITAGTINSAPCINILGNAQFPGLARDSNGNPYLYLTSADTLSVSALTTITSGKVINVYYQGGSY